MIRLFTALEIPAAVRDELALTRGGIPGARWVEPESYHVTLIFVGDIDTAAARDLTLALAEIESGPLTLAVEGLDAFGAKTPHAVIARIAKSEALLTLQARHARTAAGLGLAIEARKYTPHITLARLRRLPADAVAAWLANRPPFPPMEFSANRFVLYSSRASKGGGPYVAEAVYPLTRGFAAAEGFA